ncbi:MAG: aldehyde dehydrogenase family protein [Micromonosporaceae bacterium]|nr:aldehyde dehydrogenase family protein [Micromonosporaceae bacterium]
MTSLDATVQSCGQAARAAAPSLAAASDAVIDAVLTTMAERLRSEAGPVLAANAEDVAAAKANGMTGALLDRLLIGEERLRGMGDQLLALAAVPFPETSAFIREVEPGFRLEERRRPVGVIGANYEARPNVTVDVASQLVKSRNAGVLRTGGAALRSSIALADHVISPALAAHGLDPAAVQLIRAPEREAAYALVRQPGLIPLVILRGSGETTRALSREAATHGVRTLAHADGGGVMYLDAAADRDKAHALIRRSVDRLGVCNRLNLLLIDRRVHDQWLPEITALLRELDITPSLPPHPHARGHEWALDDGNEAMVTIDSAVSAEDAARIANDETSGLGACVVTEDAATAERFLAGYRGTGAFWNATTRLIDGFKLLGVPETGINVDHVPGPRGPVTFRDLSLRQFVVTPS